MTDQMPSQRERQSGPFECPHCIDAEFDGQRCGNCPQTNGSVLDMFARFVHACYDNEASDRGFSFKVDPEGSTISTAADVAQLIATNAYLDAANMAEDCSMGEAGEALGRALRAAARARKEGS